MKQELLIGIGCSGRSSRRCGVCVVVGLAEMKRRQAKVFLLLGMERCNVPWKMGWEDRKMVLIEGAVSNRTYRLFVQPKSKSVDQTRSLETTPIQKCRSRPNATLLNTLPSSPGVYSHLHLLITIGSLPTSIRSKQRFVGIWLRPLAQAGWPRLPRPDGRREPGRRRNCKGTE